jgi:predicted RNA binding protein YcfA (HicA-like mRNA interferase family)
MPKLPRITGKECIKKLKKLGFEEFDQTGSHEIWWNPANRKRTTIPNHPGDIPDIIRDRYTIRSIYR